MQGPRGLRRDVGYYMVESNQSPQHLQLKYIPDPDIQGANMLLIQWIRIQISREPTCCGFNGSGSGYPGSQHVADSMDPDLDIQGANMLRIQWIRIRILTIEKTMHFLQFQITD